ncbi:MAG: thioredoxin domain-containing protein [Candidatus Azobacteroides sp.]|nr:thioredoxin domain-containing protein [Candidatus Azobacteroides sp.]
MQKKSFLLLKFFIPILIGINVCFTNHSQDRDTNVIRLNFKVNEYEELMLKIRCADSTFHFAGSLNDGSWIFEYPRSLYEKCCFFNFYIPTHTHTIQHSISFKQIIDNDTLRAPEFMFDNVDTVIINAGIKIKINTFWDEEPVAWDSVNNKMAFVQSLDLDDGYFLNDITDQEYLSSVELAANRYFITTVMDTANYDNIINLYAKTVRKYPDSHSLIAMLNALKEQYRVKDNVQKIFDNFSDKQKQSYFGLKIQKFLSDTGIYHFKNILLPAWDTEIPESIIKDSSKINLVIFSASWCRPCIAEIPILKKIAGELSDKVAMVYISMDDTTTVDTWKKLMIDKEITWRSVLATNNLEEIKEQFYNLGYPTILMVYPNGKYEEIDVRYKPDLKKLYKIAGKSKE